MELLTPAQVAEREGYQRDTIIKWAKRDARLFYYQDRRNGPIQIVYFPPEERWNSETWLDAWFRVEGVAGEIQALESAALWSRERQLAPLWFKSRPSA